VMVLAFHCLPSMSWLKAGHFAITACGS